MNSLIKFNDFIIKCAKIVAIVTFIVMVASSSLQIIFRFVLNVPLPWSEELSRYTFVWSTFLGISIYIRGHKHSSVDLLEKALPLPLRSKLFVLIDILCEVFFVIVIYGGFKMVGITMNQMSPALNVPMGLMYLSIPISGIIMALLAVENILREIKTN